MIVSEVSPAKAEAREKRYTYHPGKYAKGKADGREQEGVKTRSQGVCACLFI